MPPCLQLMARDGWGSIDDKWQEFRKTLELGREIEVVDERGEPLQFGDYPVDVEDDEYD
jgi:hypothetical protein